MAHTFRLPIAFEFYSAPSKWCVAPARVIGWTETEPVIASEGELYVPDDVVIETEGQRIGRVKKSLSFNELPSKLRERIAELVCAGELSDIPELLEDCQFEVLLREVAGKARNRSVDAWSMRDEFLKLADDIQHLREFLEVWGTWDGSDVAMPTALRDSRRRFRDAMIAGPVSWLGSEYATTMLISSCPQPPYFRVITTGCCPAIETTLTIDFLKDVRLGVCARPDCTTPFSIESRHKRKFCSQYCGHLESVRRGRTRKEVF